MLELYLKKFVTDVAKLQRVGRRAIAHSIGTGADIMHEEAYVPRGSSFKTN